MFTGIIEESGTIQSIKQHGNNKTFTIESAIAAHLTPDESVSHNGICLTIENISISTYTVTAVLETILKTNAGNWKEGDLVNLERAMRMNGRLDGHIVQGHVDSTVVCTNRTDAQGSTEFTFSYDPSFAPLIIEKGSICLNGVSLTAFRVSENEFTVTIIPFTYEHTNFRRVQTGDTLNVEFDILGKYVTRFMSLRNM